MTADLHLTLSGTPTPVYLMGGRGPQGPAGLDASEIYERINIVAEYDGQTEFDAEFEYEPLKVEVLINGFELQPEDYDAPGGAVTTITLHEGVYAGDIVTLKPFRPGTGGGQWVSVQAFGAVGDGVADDTAAIARAELYCYTNNKLLNFGSGRYRITSPITLRCAFRFDKAAYGDLGANPDDGPGFIPDGLNPTVFAVTVQTRLGEVGPMSVLGDITSRVPCRGVLFDNVQRAQVHLVTVTGLDGAGIEVRMCWDSTFTALSTLQCGNATDYAVAITNGGGSTNECVFNHIQTEQAQEKGIFVSPQTYNCTFNVIHSEQVAGNGADYTHDIRGAVGVIYNSVRLTGTDVKVQLGLAGGSYNGLRVEDDAATNAVEVYLDYGVANVVTHIKGGEIQGNLYNTFGNLSKTHIEGMLFTGTGNGIHNLQISDPLALIIGDGNTIPVVSLDNNDATVTILASLIGALDTTGGNGQTFLCRGTRFAAIFALPNDTILECLDCVFVVPFISGTGGCTFNMRGNTFADSVAVQGINTIWRSDLNLYRGPLVLGAGDPTFCLGGKDVFEDTVSAGFEAPPVGTAGLNKGDAHHPPTAATGQPTHWRYNSGWVDGPLYT